jgi:hypothetical protein
LAVFLDCQKGVFGFLNWEVNSTSLKICSAIHGLNSVVRVIHRKCAVNTVNNCRKALGLILKERKDLSCRLRLLNFSFVSFVSNISFRFAV